MKNTIQIIIIATLISLILCIIFTKPWNKSINHQDEVNEYSYNNTYNNANDEQTSIEEYIPDRYDEIDTSGCYVYITNMDCLNNILTMQAIQNFYDECSNFLNSNGLYEYHELTVINNSIVKDEGLPYFECNITGSNKILSVTYNYSDSKYKFELK